MCRVKCWLAKYRIDKWLSNGQEVRWVAKLRDGWLGNEMGG
jgi:hypothetical protein